MKFSCLLLSAALGWSVLPAVSRAQEAGNTAPATAGTSSSPQVPASGEVKVGGKVITLPAPVGYERVDGRDPEVDKVVNATLPSSNRYLARFNPPASTEGAKDPATEGRSFNAQILRSLESKEITINDFRLSKGDLKKELDRLSKNIEAEVLKQTSKIGDQIKDAAGVDAALNIGNLAVLGYFDDTGESLGFSMAMNLDMKIADKNVKSREIAAALLVPVNGRMIYLYAISGYQSDADRQWAEKAVMAWRDQVVAANPKVEGSAGLASIFGQSSREARLGAIVGGIAGAGAVLWLMLRKSKK